ncbi:NfeD family protein [Vitreoscilla stercoraria]|uniref:NfeD family protein n=1 Tax=Vitreoscilla stercoraria TaxID=61 RepID=A0ABY4E7C7_VITST|nr:NfeD family protein [Vitreoscilla stercoraria]UOO91672.1 NfeD family protein [Vitreoscilla stercoraria]
MYWLIAAVVLIVLEVMIGTFYLLVVAAALASVGLTEWLFGTPLSVNLSLFAVLCLLGIPLARRFQKNRSQRTKAVNLPLDIGQTVIIEKHLHHQIYQVKYRGTTWQAQLNEGEAEANQTAYIYTRQGNLLYIQLIESVHQTP